MKKYLALILALVMCAALFAGCSPSAEPPAAEDPAAPVSEPTGEETTITVWAWDPNFNIAIMNAAAEAYKAENPSVKVEILEMAKADVEQKLHTTLAAQTTEGVPEIVLIEDYNAQKYLTSYPGLFADLTEKFNYDEFAAYKTELMTVDGKTYGVPFDSGVAGFFYRTDILEEAGYSAADLEDITWDQFIEIGKAVKEKTGKYFLSFDKVDGGIMRIMLQSAGEWYFNEAGEPALADSAALAEAMTIYKEIVDSGIAKPVTGWDEWCAGFNSGECASVTSGCWIIGTVKAPADQSGLWAVAPVPKLATVESKHETNLGGSSWYILENAKNRDAAIEFMQKVYAANTEFYQTILMNNGAIGTWLPATEGDAYSTPDEFFAGAAIYEDLSAWMSKIPTINYGSYTYEADAAIMAQMDSYISGAMTLDEAIAAAQTQLENSIQ